MLSIVLCFFSSSFHGASLSPNGPCMALPPRGPPFFCTTYGGPFMVLALLAPFLFRNSGLPGPRFGFQEVGALSPPFFRLVLQSVCLVEVLFPRRRFFVSLRLVRMLFFPAFRALRIMSKTDTAPGFWSTHSGSVLFPVVHVARRLSTFSVNEPFEAFSVSFRR